MPFKAVCGTLAWDSPNISSSRYSRWERRYFPLLSSPETDITLGGFIDEVKRSIPPERLIAVTRRNRNSLVDQIEQLALSLVEQASTKQEKEWRDERSQQRLCNKSEELSIQRSGGSSESQTERIRTILSPIKISLKTNSVDTNCMSSGFGIFRSSGPVHVIKRWNFRAASETDSMEQQTNRSNIHRVS